jgi:Photosynthetic reaction centre cytochrome C subunit
MQSWVRQFITAAVVMLGVAYLIMQAQDDRGDADAGKKKKAGTPVVNMQQLPRDVDLHIMELFRSALGVECNYCHVAGEFQEKGHVGDRQSDANPKKLIARNMIRMTKEINLALAGSSAYPDAKNVVTCWTCHRGHSIPPIAP